MAIVGDVRLEEAKAFGRHAFRGLARALTVPKRNVAVEPPQRGQRRTTWRCCRPQYFRALQCPGGASPDLPASWCSSNCCGRLGSNFARTDGAHRRQPDSALAGVADDIATGNPTAQSDIFTVKGSLQLGQPSGARAGREQRLARDEDSARPTWQRKSGRSRINSQRSERPKTPRPAGIFRGIGARDRLSLTARLPRCVSDSNGRTAILRRQEHGRLVVPGTSTKSIGLGARSTTPAKLARHAEWSGSG